MSRHGSTALADLGVDPKAVDRDLRQFRRSAQAVPKAAAADKALAGKWLAGYGGKVVASAATMNAVLRALDAKRIPSARPVVRFIDTGERVLIL